MLAVCQPAGATSDAGAAGEARQSARPAAQTDAPSVRSSLQALSRALGSLRRTASVPAPDDEAFLRARQRATAALDALVSLSRKWPAQSPADYRHNLATLVAIAQAVARTPDSPHATALVDALADELEIKLEHCLRSGGALGGAIVLRVRTLRPDVEVKNWQVFYLPRILDGVEGATPDVFSMLSSPTQEPLVPGRYVVWARDPVTQQTSERLIVKVGEGRKEQRLDLVVTPRQ